MSAADPATSNAADAPSAPPAPPAALIYPPADIMTIVDKTAEHVAKSGPAFQQLIRDKYRDNSKFSFIYATDPYHAYYSHKVEHYKANASSSSSSSSTAQQQQADNPSDPSLVVPEEDTAAADGPEKPADAQFLCPLPMVSAQDLDVIKTTAQFVARNGRSFMQTLAHRESANYQFDFLKPSHTLFAYFRRLVDQYTLVFFPPPSLTERLQSDVRDKARVLRRVEQRMRWAAVEEEEKRKREEEREREKEGFLSVDWHDFTVVGTVEFVEEDEEMELPAPLSMRDLMTMSLEDKHRSMLQDVDSAAAGGAADAAGGAADAAGAGEQMDVDETDVDEHLQADRIPQPAPAIAPMRIRKDYVPTLRRGIPAAPVLLKCQLCQLDIPAADFEEHIRVELIDPKWKEQKRVYERKIKDSNLVQEGMDIAKYLGQLAAHRAEESAETPAMAAGVKGPVAPWDGYSSTKGSAARRARENMTREEADAARLLRQGMPDPRDPALKIGPQMPPPPPTPTPTPHPPAPKRQKN